MKYLKACQILGVTSDTPFEEIESAYRRLLQRTHPDKGGDPDEFREVVQAFKTVKHQYPIRKRNASFRQSSKASNGRTDSTPKSAPKAASADFHTSPEFNQPDAATAAEQYAYFKDKFDIPDDDPEKMQAAASIAHQIRTIHLIYFVMFAAITVIFQNAVVVSVMLILWLTMALALRHANVSEKILQAIDPFYPVIRSLSVVFSYLLQLWSVVFLIWAVAQFL